MISMTNRRLVSETWVMSPSPGQKDVDESIMQNSGVSLEDKLRSMVVDEMKSCELGSDCQLDCSVDRDRGELGVTEVTISTQCLLPVGTHCGEKVVSLAVNASSFVNDAIISANNPDHSGNHQ